MKDFFHSVEFLQIFKHLIYLDGIACNLTPDDVIMTSLFGRQLHYRVYTCVKFKKVPSFLMTIVPHAKFVHKVNGIWDITKIRRRKKN